MTKQDYIERQKKICRDEWFKDHKANFCGDASQGACITINWQNPKSWNYGCRFIIHRRWLIVVGDIGEAIYEWSEDITLAFLASLDFGYFHSKCQSSETGRNFEMWEHRFCIPALRDFLEDDEREDKEKLIENASGHTFNQQEWTDFLYRGDYELRDDDYVLAGAGLVAHPRSIGHFVGIQMAIEQLKGQA